MKVIRSAEVPTIPASHENPDAPGVWKRILATRGDFIEGHVQMVNWAHLPVGSAFQPHYHEDMQEIFVIVAGRAEIRAGETVAELAAGDAVLIPPRQVHQMRNTGHEVVNYVVVGVAEGETGRTIVVAGE